MDATDLRDGFRLGEWLVEPREARISGPAGVRGLEPAQLELLLFLAGRHGESVDGRSLCERAWPGQAADDSGLQGAIGALRAALGRSSDDQTFIVGVADGGYALIGHLEARAAPGPTRGGRVQGFVAELQRRSVFKVAGAYLVGMWVVLQVAETTFEPLRFPDWWMTALTILAVLGLPIIVVLAWSYEITPGGIVLDDGARRGVPRPRARRAVAPVIVAGVALMAGVTGVAWWRSIDDAPGPGATRSAAAQPSIAVLPLVDMSPAGGNDYLGDGLSEELSLRLAQIPGLRVAARTSAFEFKGRNLDVRRIGEALGVGHVLEGSVRRDGDNLRVTVQLIESASGYHLWAGSYDRGWSDVLAIQDDIARSITDALRVVLAPEDPARGAGSGPAPPDVRAFEPYLAGLAILRQSGDMSRLQEAATRFRAALAISPGFARAHAGLCDVGLRIFNRTRDPADRSAAETACRSALGLDESLVETEKALASLYVADGRYAEAETILRAIVARHPRDAGAHVGLARALDGAGRYAEAEAGFRAAVAVEPGYWGAYDALGAFLFEQGRAAEAIEQYRRVTELTPSSATAFNNLGAALQFSGEQAAAADAFRRSLQVEPSRSAYSNLGTAHYYLGEFAQAEGYYAKATSIAGEDQSMWGNLADAQWQIPGRREEAVRNYRRAIALAERDRASAGGDAALTAQLGYYYGRAGEYDRGGRLLAEALATGRDGVQVQYFVAVSAADRRDAAAALDALEAAVRLGYPVALIRSTPEFAFLAGNARFERVTSKQGG